MATGKRKIGTEAKQGEPQSKTVRAGNQDAVLGKTAPVTTKGPTARACPLVLDGEMDARDFTPAACMSCDEFDCPHCEGTQGSGALRSRLFASDDANDMGDDGGWGNDDGSAFGAEEEEPEDDPDLFSY